MVQEYYILKTIVGLVTFNELYIPSGSNQDKIYHDWTPDLNILYYTLPVEILKKYVIKDTLYINNLYNIYDVSINNNKVETARSLKNGKLISNIMFYLVTIIIIVYVLISLIRYIRNMDCSPIIHPLEYYARSNEISQPPCNYGSFQFTNHNVGAIARINSTITEYRHSLDNIQSIHYPRLS